MYFFIFPNKESVIGFAEGYGAGTLGMLVGHPFIVLKTRLQGMKGATSISQQVMKLNLAGCYKGIVPPLLTYGLWSSFSFAGFEWGKRQVGFGKPRAEVPAVVLRLGGQTDAELARTQIFLAGIVGGCSATMMHPTNVLSSLQMVNDTPGSSSFRKTFELMVQLWRVEGLAGFYRGVSLALPTVGLGCGVYFWTYAQVKEIMQNAEGQSTFLGMAFAGGVSGMVGRGVGALGGPADTVMSRIMVQPIGQRRYTSAFDCLCRTYAEGGVSLLFRGITLNMVRAFPVSAVLLPTADLIRSALEDALPD